MRERLTKPPSHGSTVAGFGHIQSHIGGGAVATLGGSLGMRAHAAVARGCHAFEGFVRALRRRQPLRSAAHRLSAWAVELTAAQLRHLQRLADDARERRLLQSQC